MKNLKVRESKKSQQTRVSDFQYSKKSEISKKAWKKKKKDK